MYPIALLRRSIEREHDSRISCWCKHRPSATTYTGALPRRAAPLDRQKFMSDPVPPAPAETRREDGRHSSDAPPGKGRREKSGTVCSLFSGRFRLSRSARDPWRPGPQPRRRPWPPAGGRATRGERRAHRPASSSSFTSARWASIALSRLSVHSGDARAGMGLSDLRVGAQGSRFFQIRFARGAGS